ncbi:two component transcriptional regulator, LytTR family [Parasphingorhabdus marina DSM 22363]|uniref:Two component transcriptional regulator, LytTR family n=1 Tax=Parasphingorhabdus marina DSM 22363 TaxID=1123272 RepID=A0A1N6CTN9_9SPHN|nr:LytTR family DNA-binding domain-containing protein [Parasphingorhabdus marina]SIN61839.1 two component transcriptional regulator, LytTR family [Parasphingorhabdus marina DSM 22363]
MTEDAPKPLDTLIVDDEPLAIERLQLLCARLPDINLVGTASDGEAAIRLAEQLKPDLLLLDIAMPGMDGLEVAKSLSETGQSPAIIFVTAFDKFAVEAFGVAAIDYVLKPVESDRLSLAVSRVRERKAVTSGTAEEESPWAEEFWVPYKSELRRIAASEIDRVEAERDYMRLHVGSASYLLHQTISGLEERLNPDEFVRLHRSHLVRKDWISGLRHDGGGIWMACLKCGTEIRIGRTHLAEAKKLAGR